MVKMGQKKAGLRTELLLYSNVLGDVLAGQKKAALLPQALVSTAWPAHILQRQNKVTI